MITNEESKDYVDQIMEKVSHAYLDNVVPVTGQLCLEVVTPCSRTLS